MEKRFGATQSRSRGASAPRMPEHRGPGGGPHGGASKERCEIYTAAPENAPATVRSAEGKTGKADAPGFRAQNGSEADVGRTECPGDRDTAPEGLSCFTLNVPGPLFVENIILANEAQEGLGRRFHDKQDSV